MGDLQRYIQQRKLKDSVFAKDFEAGYELVPLLLSPVLYYNP